MTSSTVGVWISQISKGYRWYKNLVFIYIYIYKLRELEIYGEETSGTPSGSVPELLKIVLRSFLMNTLHSNVCFFLHFSTNKLIIIIIQADPI